MLQDPWPQSTVLEQVSDLFWGFSEAFESGGAGFLAEAEESMQPVVHSVRIAMVTKVLLRRRLEHLLLRLRLTRIICCHGDSIDADGLPRGRRELPLVPCRRPGQVGHLLDENRFESALYTI